MSVSTLRRIFLVAALLSAPALLANNPSSTTGGRMVFDETNGSIILFGGVTSFDAGLSNYVNPPETWRWNGARWIQLFPANTPPARSSHIMVWDSKRSRAVIFGGKQGGGTTSTDLNDTWMFQNNDWSQVLPTDSPSPRSFSGAAYDRSRDRIVLFGGTNQVAPPTGAATPTVTNDFDTWEFDGSNWTKVADNGPQVLNPILVYDEARNQTVLVAEDSGFIPRMYTYDAGAHAWNQVQPATMPPCVNQAEAAFERASGTIVLTGGVCSRTDYSSPTTEEIYSWDGTNWTKLVAASTVAKTSDLAIAYDARRDVILTYGGTEAFGAPHAYTYTFDPSLVDSTLGTNGDWVSHDPNFVTPGPRSLASFTTDPVNNVIYLLNGNTDGTIFTDFWIYQNGGWRRVVDTATPACGTPYAAFDTDRAKLVVVCSDGTTNEWDAAASTWAAFPSLTKKPSFTQFASMAYDATLKQTVLYGGYDGSNWVNNTWEWNGTAWTQMKKNAAPARGLTAMWYDPNLKKTVIFGGIGRPTSSDSVKRYNDMWSLDNSNGWTEVKPSLLPNTRYGAQIATDPNTGRTLMFGGLRLDTEIKNGSTLFHQVYANDMWQWDGSTWTQVTTANTPPPRENGAFAYDYGRHNFVLFGGWSGYYHGDSWTLNGTTWQVVPEPSTRGRIVSPTHP